MRNSLGQFVTGHTGNAGGRPKDEHKVAELARSYTLEAIETLVELMRSGKSERIRGTAAQALLDRGWGKPGAGKITTDSSASFIDALEGVRKVVDARKAEAS